MEYHQLANTSIRVSRIGFGCGPASGYDYGRVDEKEWELSVHSALENGINFFDVAEVYGFGRAEEMLSHALGNRRHDVVVATKCGLVWDKHGKVRRDLSKQSVLASVEASLHRLRLNVIPLYQIHWPDSSTPIEETLETLAQCQEQGKIRYLGVSNFPPDLLRRAYDIRPFQSEQLAYNLLCREPERDVFPWCNSHDVSILAHSGLARGFLGGRYLPGDGVKLSDTRKASLYFSDEGHAEKEGLLDAIRKIAAQANLPFSSISIRWILDRPDISVVLVGIKTREQLNEILQSLGWQLHPKDRRLLDDISARCPGGQAGTPAHEKSVANRS